MENWVLFAFIIFAAALLQASTGFGFSIVGTPFLFLLFPIHTAIQINIILSICLSAIMIYNIRKEIDKHLLLLLIKGSLFGLIAGLLVYLFLNVQWLKVIVGGFIIILTALLILKLTIRKTRARDYLVGGISGLLTTSIGVPGPPLLLYFSGVGTNKAALRSTTLAYYLFVYFASLAMQIGFDGTNKGVWMSSLIGLPSLIIGILAGQMLFKWINQRAFKIITYVILLFTGFSLIMTVF
jgi:uncharacterized membrane protein YfcA